MRTAEGGSHEHTPDPVAAIIAYFRSGLAELRCLGSERLVRRGLSMGHLYVLSMLDRHGEMAMSRIAEVLDISLSNATGVVDRMEERGLVERVRQPGDRRVVLVRLTPAAREVLEEIEVFRNDVMLAVLGRLTPTQLNRLAHAVEDVRRAIEEVRHADPALLGHLHGGAGTHAHGHPAETHASPQVTTPLSTPMAAGSAGTEGRN
jgi:DNA-binding MarR family transcriptional regulator